MPNIIFLKLLLIYTYNFYSASVGNLEWSDTFSNETTHKLKLAYVDISAFLLFHFFQTSPMLIHIMFKSCD